MHGQHGDDGRRHGSPWELPSGAGSWPAHPVGGPGNSRWRPPGATSRPPHVPNRHHRGGGPVQKPRRWCGDPDHDRPPPWWDHHGAHTPPAHGLHTAGVSSKSNGRPRTPAGCAVHGDRQAVPALAASSHLQVHDVTGEEGRAANGPGTVSATSGHRRIPAVPRGNPSRVFGTGEPGCIQDHPGDLAERRVHAQLPGPQRHR